MSSRNKRNERVRRGEQSAGSLSEAVREWVTQKECGRALLTAVASQEERCWHGEFQGRAAMEGSATESKVKLAQSSGKKHRICDPVVIVAEEKMKADEQEKQEPMAGLGVALREVKLVSFGRSGCAPHLTRQLTPSLATEGPQPQPVTRPS
ncbi:hypothetical protein CIHG_02710 [Coccidioides immitis H538.4]|uniref:Uncharacterized protein n=3 Tax=Coccidioides immitis TaxID=5501 RepID=A0A0J8QN49_COCIT|nr:hypothetical protein CIRG_03038 [Coccidioides immitis RMSCC 2394]KMU73886.1 hypothetical protein CISG_03864 [Coccidioides immitis RMSCC 3703]KMU84927.1 hypothetical protein CIHG_02710 [Coccidioides immitis H538.4]